MLDCIYKRTVVLKAFWWTSCLIVYKITVVLKAF